MMRMLIFLSWDGGRGSEDLGKFKITDLPLQALS